VSRDEPVYSAHDHGVMIADRARVGAYRAALARTVAPGDVVVDLGTGTGLLALFACQMGARKVYAIEAEEIIELAREIAAANGCADRIEFIRGHSTAVQLPGRADVVVSDVHGALPMFGRGLESVRDARARFLKDDGRLIPRRDHVWIAAAELSAKDYGQVAVWSDGRWGVDLSPGTRFGVDAPFSVFVGPEALRSAPACLASIDYAQLESPSLGGSASLQIARDAVVHGFALWFDAELAEGVHLSSAPGEAVGVYPRKFAPWPHPVALRAGDVVDAHVTFAWVHDDYVWRWNTEIRSANGEERERFVQSSFNSLFITLEPLRKRAPSHRPSLSDAGEAQRAILELMNGERTLQEIASEVASRYPRVFADLRTALRAVADLATDVGE
jgi:protein arginine N-methyltransferase 1